MSDKQLHHVCVSQSKHTSTWITLSAQRFSLHNTENVEIYLSNRSKVSKITEALVTIYTLLKSTQGHEVCPAMYSEDTSSATISTVRDVHFTMATHGQSGGENEKRCIEGLERRLIKRGSITHLLIGLRSPPCWRNTIAFRPRSCRLVISWQKRNESEKPRLDFDWNVRMRSTLSCNLYAVSGAETDSVVNHQTKTQPTCWHGCMT